MKPVLQQSRGYPYGSCVQTTYASLLELPLSEVPRFDTGSLGGKSQLQAEREWLRSRGLDLVVVMKPVRGQIRIPPDLFHLISGTNNQSGIGHRVVGRGGNVVWDGNPDGGGIKKIKAYLFVVPLVPSR